MLDRDSISEPYFQETYYYFLNKIKDNSLDTVVNEDAIAFFKKHLDIDIVGKPDASDVFIREKLSIFCTLVDDVVWRRFQVYYNQRAARGILNKTSVKAQYKTTCTVTVNDEQLALVKETQESLKQSGYSGTGRGGRITQSDVFEYLINGGSLPPLEKLKLAIDKYYDAIDEYHSWCFDGIDEVRPVKVKELIDSGIAKPTIPQIDKSVIEHLNANNHKYYSIPKIKPDFVRFNKNTIKR